MLYNHRQFRKNSDKKIMRKVKKNWIVLSVASFALIGASAVIESNQNISFASETQVAANTNTNQNNNNSTIDNQKKDAKNHLDDEATKVKDAINNDDSLSQSDKDSQNAEVDSYKIAGEQSIDSATDSNGINQALSDGENNIDSSHVKGQMSNDQNNVNDSNADSSSDNQNSQSTISNQSLQSSAESMSSGASLVSSASSSNESDDGISLRDGTSDAPADSNTYISGPKNDYGDAIANTKLNYNGVNYDPTTGNYVINFQFGSKEITRNGLNRVLEFALNMSPNLSDKVTQVTVTNADGTRTLNNNYIKYPTGRIVGGNISISVYVSPVKVTSNDWISAFMSTHREYSNGTPMKTSTEIAFSSTRSLTYDKFGDDFNSQLLSNLRSRTLDDLNQTSPLSQTTKLKNNYVSKINAVTTNDDFVNVLNSIKNAYKADNSSLSNAISQLNSQSATSKNNVSNLGNLPANDKQTANNSINSALQTAKSKVMGVSQSSDIAGALSDGINSIKKIELQATINSAINDINNAVANTTNKINSDITLSKENADKQLKSVSEHKTSYTGLIQSSNDLSKISGLRDNAVNQINSDYTPGPSLSTQKQTAKDSLDNEANKIKAAIDADNTLTNDEKNRQKSKVDIIKAAAQSQIDSATNADGVNNAQSQGISSIDNAHQTSSTSLSDQQANAKGLLDDEATKVKQQIDADNSLTSSEKATQKANVDSVKAIDQGKIDAATNVDDINAAYQQGIKDIDSQYAKAQTSLPDQKSNAKAQLDAEATKVKQQIEADNSLTSSEKATQKANVDNVKAIDQGKVDAATNADDINSAYQQGIRDIDSQYATAKTSLPDQKSNAKAKLDAEATKVKQQIEADNSLTSSEKATQKANVDSVKSTYQGRIDAATNADDINSAYQQGIKDIDNQYVTGKTSVADQQSNAKAQLDAEATKVRQQIDSDNTLTSEEKAKQKANVYSTKSIDQTAIDMATNADDINTAYHKGIQDIDNQYIPGKTSLADQKANAKRQLDAQAAKIKSDIENDATLTQNQKNDQMNQLAAHKVAAEQAIDNAADADGIYKAAKDSDDQISSDHKPGTSVNSQKDTNNAKLNAEATKVKNKIDADVSLTSDEKAEQKNNVENEKSTAQSKIDSAVNADDIKSAYDQGIKEIDAQYVPGKTSLADQKTNAKAQLDAEAAKVKQDISNDATLTQIKKNEQIAMVDYDKESAETAIDVAKDADAVNKAISDGKKNIDLEHQPGKSLADQKADAKATIQAEANKIKSEIDADSTLTSADKAAQKDKVDNVSAADQNKIDGLTNVDDIYAQTTQSKSDIDAQHQAGKDLNDQKQSAKDQLDATAAKIKQYIENDVTLTQADKDAQKAKVDSDTSAGKQAIDNSANADDIKKLISNTSDKINGAHVPGQAVNDQKTAKKAELDAEANKIKAAIDADNTLTQSQKDAQKANVDADVADSKKAIDNASDAEGIKQIIDSSNAKIDGEHQSGKSIDDQKANAKSTLDAEANKTKAAIDADNTLTSAEKQQQKNNVDQVNQAAKDKIDAASSADEINDLVSRNSQSIDAQHQPGKSVSDQKTAAKNQLDAEAKKIKDAIDADQTLSQSEKNAQKSAVDADVVSGKQAIDNSSDADSINKAIGDTNDKIDVEHVSGKPLSDQKTNAKSQLDSYAESIKNAIDNDATLTQSEKDAQKDKVDDDVKAGKQGIDNANDADSINKLVSDTNNKVKNEHQPGISVADQKTNAKKQLDDQADKVKNDIQNDPTLTQTEKNNQMAKVDSDVTAGKQAIDNSSDADSINKVVSDANDKVSADHVSGTSLDNQKTAANAKLDAEANKTKAAIDADNTLTSAEKTTQKAKVDSDVANGKQNIEKATDADSINKLVNDTKEQVDAQHVPGQSLDAQKQAAKQVAEDKAKQTKAAIDADNTLTSAEKTAQKNKVDSENATAQDKIDSATNADDINSLSDRMIGDISQSYVPGTSLDAQKQAAKDKLSQHVQDLINQIFGDDTLTQAEKDAQKDKVDNDKAAAEKSIDAASDADNINQALSDARPKLDADYIPGASLSDQKNDAKAKLDETAAKVKNAIANDATLTQTEKNNQLDKVDSDVAAGKQAIDNAKNSDSINKAVDDTSAQVSDDHKYADSIDTQKTNAKNQLTAKADKIKQDIENDATLTQAEKESQKAKVEDDVKSGNQAIDNASDADSINKAESDSDSQVSSEHKPAASLDVQKENAKSAIDEAAKNTKAAIDADNTLTSAEKESQKVKVDENATASKQAIDNAQNADNINSSVSVGKTDVNDVHKSADSIDTQKTGAKSQLDANTAKIKQDIANDDTLTQAEKDAQTKQVDADKATAEQAIDNALDADEINQALKDGNTKTSGDHKPGNSTNDQKAAAKKKLDAEAEKIKNAIDNDDTLNSTEKAQQKQNVDSQNQAARDKVDASTNADDINSASDQGVSNIDEQHKSSDVSLSQQKENAKSQLDAQAAKVKNDIANDATLTQTEKDAQMAQVDADKAAGKQAIDNAPDADSINKAISNSNAKIDADHVSGQLVADQKTSAKDAINNEANKVKVAIDADKTLGKTEKQRQRNNVERAQAEAQAAIDGLTNADDINAAVADYIQIIDIQHVKKQNNGSGPEQTIPRNIYMVKNFYRYLSTNFTKKNRVQGYKATSRPNAAMFRIIGETTNKNGVKRYKVYQIVVKKNGLFKVDRKKWGYITARPSYMRPLYYSSNVQQIKVIGRGIREYKNVKLSNVVKGYKRGTVLNVKAVKKLGSTYRLQLTNGHYITANKNLVRKQTTPRNVYMVKGFYRYSSVNFSHKNRIHGYKKQARPNAVMFRIVGETTNKNGLKRYKVNQIVRNKKGLFRVDHKKWGYITTNSSYVKPLYYSNGVHEVRVISDRIRVYKNLKLTKSVKSYKRGTVLKVKTVKKIGSTYRFQLTNGNYISANKNLVQKIN
ncbi:DUF1542 domain-containing protein [Apilactobacillus kunkeei]|uniref:DUF1542 domain-containing protein n=1 Tax=Apilactobacillus kunkeei TaxID=148814 RepID=UPI002009FFA6|nr:DUF1542 domain-containing protein [Apilactobacillus kunkeei]MCK8628349.1 DUF1542 domain-containing protein [Apilactobacillus kunkeei]